MSTLAILGVWSFVFVVIFTANAYRTNTGVGQTPRGAIIEAWAHIIVGFSLNMAMNQLMIPLMTGGHGVSLSSNWWGGWVYTAVSLVRTYLIRRASNALHTAARHE